MAMHGGTCEGFCSERMFALVAEEGGGGGGSGRPSSDINFGEGRGSAGFRREEEEEEEPRFPDILAVGLGKGKEEEALLPPSLSPLTLHLRSTTKSKTDSHSLSSSSFSRN